MAESSTECDERVNSPSAAGELPVEVALLPPERRPRRLTLPERVYLRLRADIIEARLPAGTELRERDIAEELDVSRVPVREALPRLVAGGFVTVEPRRPAVVTHISIADVHELYDLRAPVEAAVARLAARRVAAGGADPERLRRLVEAADHARADAEYNTFQRVNIDLHAEIVALADNGLLPALMAPLVDRTDRLNNVSKHHDRAHRHDEHAMLVDAIAAGQSELASHCAFVHIEKERARALESLPSHPHYAGH